MLKLLRPGFPAGLAEQEVEVARLVESLFAAVPHCFGLAHAGTRVGVVYERIVGPSMDEAVRARPWRYRSLARRFGELHGTMHAARGAGLPDQRSRLRSAIDRAAPALPPGARDGALARLERLPDGPALCHGDLHPGNLLLGEHGPRVIDWENARCGDPEGDVARTLYLIVEPPLDVPGLLHPVVQGLRSAFARAYLARYRQLRPLDEERLRAWRLPILAARMAEGIAAEAEPLRASIRRELQGRG